MNLETLKNLFKNHKEPSLYGRYIQYDYIAPLIQKYSQNFIIENIGSSVLGVPIHAIKIGSGSRKIFMWSQMHGNESTTTKAIFDICSVFNNSKDSTIQRILSTCTIAIIPMLNPDGANAYTRVNANNIDLNRDALDRSQPESIVLRRFFDAFKPDVCFNLHGQRTIFSAGQTNHPATLSFLAPAQDKACTITDTRKNAMEIIVRMNEALQIQIPNQVGIYDDAFNVNCVGDTFQSLNVPTVLFEAGHYDKDYDREVVREFMFQSLMIAIDHVAFNDLTGKNHKAYLKIPQNQKLFYDIVIRNAMVRNKICDVAVQYQEKLVSQNINFVPIVDKISNLNGFYGHKEVNANNCRVLTIEKEELYVGYENDFALINNELFSFNI